MVSNVYQSRISPLRCMRVATVSDYVSYIVSNVYLYRISTPSSDLGTTVSHYVSNIGSDMYRECILIVSITPVWYIAIHSRYSTIRCILYRYNHTFHVYTAPGTARASGSWNPWKRAHVDSAGPPQCQKSARKKITCWIGTVTFPWSLVPSWNGACADLSPLVYRNLYRLAYRVVSDICISIRIDKCI